MSGRDAEPEREHAVLKQLLALWDNTLRPQANDRTAKRGYGVSVRATAIANQDGESNEITLHDGVSDLIEDGIPGDLALSDLAADALLESDNWILRPHFDDSSRVSDPSGDVTWDVRLISDHTNPSDGRMNIGTQVIDQEWSQIWAWLQDLFWVTDRGTPLSDRELALNYAGRLGMLFADGGGGVFTRGQLALNVAANQGLYTDGTKFAPFKHIIGFLAKGGAGGTQAGGGGNRPAVAVEGCLLADAAYRWPDGAARSLPIIEKAPEDTTDQGQACIVHFYEGAELGNSNTMATDVNSNHPEIGKPAHPSIAGYVKVPTTYCPVEKQPGNPSSPVPPTEPSGDTPTPPSKGTASPFSGVPVASPGVPTSFTVEIDVPTDVPDMTYVDVDIPVAISGAYGKAQSSDLSIGTKTAKDCDSGGASTIAWQTKSLTSADGLHTNNYRVLRKTIPASDLVDKNKAIVVVNMISTSTGPKLTMKNPTAKFSCALPVPSTLPRIV